MGEYMMTDKIDTETIPLTPELKRKRGISPIWILPLIAVVIAAWLVYKSLMDAGIDVIITFKNAQGIEAGKTQVIYRGMPIGLVKSLRINKDFRERGCARSICKGSKESIEERHRSSGKWNRKYPHGALPAWTRC